MVEGEEFDAMLKALGKGYADVEQQQDAEELIAHLLNKVSNQEQYMAEFMVSRSSIPKGVL